jgi:hypothetical protein
MKNMKGPTLLLFGHILSLLVGRDAALEIAKQFLPGNLFQQAKLASFGPTPVQVGVSDADQLFRDAAVAKSKIDSVLARWLGSKQLDPERVVTSEGFKTFTAAPLKSRDRCTQKAKAEYGGDITRLADVARCTIVVDDEVLLAELLEVLMMGMQGIRVVRLKNRFANPLFTGIMDCLLNVSVDIGGGRKHIAEIQLHMAPILELKKDCHVPYEFFRDYFKGSPESYEKRMKIFDRLRGSGGAASLSGLELAQDILTGDEVGR